MGHANPDNSQSIAFGPEVLPIGNAAQATLPIGSLKASLSRQVLPCLACAHGIFRHPDGGQRRLPTTFCFY
jgi:hypothetical protein